MDFINSWDSSLLNAILINLFRFSMLSLLPPNSSPSYLASSNETLLQELTEELNISLVNGCTLLFELSVFQV